MLLLYGRARCSLCDEMAGALRQLGIAFDEVDVDQDPALAARYGRRVPVLADGDGNELCAGRQDAGTLRARLALE